MSGKRNALCQAHRTFGTGMSMTLRDSPSLVYVDWLAANLSRGDLVVVDGSFKLPGATPTAEEDFESRHIDGAVFFDVDRVADLDSSLPHMLPDEKRFAASMEDLGVSNETFVVVYDSVGLMSAGRVWWMLRAFGHQRVAVLNGGLRCWLAEGHSVTDHHGQPHRGTYSAGLRKEFVANRGQLMKNLTSRKQRVFDARSAPRFDGNEREPRQGLRSGHIPGSYNVPFNELTDPSTGKLKSVHALREIFDRRQIDWQQPAVATCGSGVTACAIAFALHLCGKDDVAVYDGAWAEWGMPGITPVEARG
jgi:thiosulfate/3-mercaptopyruvate sulfurtransferase